jgi:hypothetical protein
MNRRTSAAMLAIAGIVSGCVSQVARPDDEALVAPAIRFVVPIPAAADGSLGIAQSIVAHYRDRTFTFEAQIQTSPGKFDLAALDGLGRRALTVHWSAGRMDFTAAPWLPAIVTPVDVLADIAIIYGPRDATARAIANSGATITETPTSLTITKNNCDLIVVEYGKGEGWNRSAKLRNLAYGYEIDIQSAEIPP